MRLNEIIRRKINKTYVFWFQFPVKCGTRTPVGLQGCTVLAVSTWLLSVLIEATLSRHIRESASGGDDRKQRAGCSLQADMQYLCNVIVSQITPPHHHPTPETSRQWRNESTVFATKRGELYGPALSCSERHCADMWDRTRQRVQTATTPTVKIKILWLVTPCSRLILRSILPCPQYLQLYRTFNITTN